MKCYGHVNGQRVVVLFNPGSTQDVVNSVLMKRVRLQTTPITPLPVLGFSEGMDASISEE